MSRINFDSLRRDEPTLGPIWERLMDWVQQHPDVSFFDPRRLAVELYPVAAFDLASALSVLAKRGEVKRVYRVRQPNGAFIGGVYSSIEDIPDEIADRTADTFIEPTPANIQAVFEIKD